MKGALQSRLKRSRGRNCMQVTRQSAQDPKTVATGSLIRPQNDNGTCRAPLREACVHEVKRSRGQNCLQVACQPDQYPLTWGPWPQDPHKDPRVNICKEGPTKGGMWAAPLMSRGQNCMKATCQPHQDPLTPGQRPQGSQVRPQNDNKKLPASSEWYVSKLLNK